MKEILTKRLALRSYAAADRQDFINMFTNKAVMRHVGEGAMELQEAERLWKNLDNNAGRREIRAVSDVASGEYLGNASIIESPYQQGELEIGFVLREGSWGKGFGTEIANGLVKYCFENLDVEQVFASVDDDHAASIKVLKKSGMKLFRYEFDEAGRFSIYSIKKSVGESN